MAPQRAGECPGWRYLLRNLLLAANHCGSTSLIALLVGRLRMPHIRDDGNVQGPVTAYLPFTEEAGSLSEWHWRLPKRSTTQASSRDRDA